MAVTPFDRPRQIIPRWRPIASAINLGELLIARKNSSQRTIVASAELLRRLDLWKRERNLVAAAELVETSLVEGLDGNAHDAAQFIVKGGSGATELVRLQAALLLHRLGDDKALVEIKKTPLDANITIAKSLTRSAPRDAFAWCDLALFYASIGIMDKASRAMTVALALAPHDRHILRSAARCFILNKDEGAAHDLLRRNAATAGDPWLTAAEIAVARFAKEKPAFAKKGQSLLDAGNFSDRHLSELSSAVATLHLENGNRKARKLFERSLLDPTGNAVAQAESRKVEANLPRISISPRDDDFAEARSFEALWEGKFEEAIHACGPWMEQEPYSVRPFIQGSSLSIAIEDVEQSLKFADKGLRIHPKDPILINNKAYALIESGKVAEAAELLRGCIREFRPEQTIAATATLGMALIRLGSIEQGEKEYHKAIASFRRLADSSSVAQAYAYFAKEAVRSDLPSKERVIAEANDALKSAPRTPIAVKVLERAKSWNAAKTHRKAGHENFNVSHGSQATKPDVK